ncbi:MAG TPA: VCBS repeat-containing protein [Pyrinomonadaceae bacterium]|nr:VCBS repeat-containing protein [Pyrinomonadaceae bacterium]
MFYSRTPRLMTLLLVLIVIMVSPAAAQTFSFSRLDRDLPLENPSQLVTGDFNKDGNLDLVFAYEGVANVFVLLGNGDGTFGPELHFVTLGPPSSLVTGDFDDDGNLDLAAAVTSRNSIVVLFGAGNGNVVSLTELPAGPSPFDAPLGVVAGDFDRDGTQDLMSIAVGSNVISFLKSNGDRTFGPYTFAGVLRDDPLMIIQADFNLDTNPDIATANFDFFGITAALGTGTGTLLHAFELPTTNAGAVALTTADFNHDSFPDLAFLQRFPSVPGTVSLVLGHGDGTFGPARSDRSTGLDPRAILSGDFNLDGDPDLVVANFLSNTISILPGTDDVFQVGSAQDISFFDKPIALAAGDFNNDCRPDLAVLTAGNGALAILLNSTPKPPLEIVGVELNRNVLWPANHKMVDVTVGYSTTNNCGHVTCTLSVVSNEPINGTGDSDSAPDWEIIDEHHLRLRAERAGNGSGRVYTITITCTDSSGSSVRAVTVVVPKNQSK